MSRSGATVTSAEGLVQLHQLFKPLAMLLAMAVVVRRARAGAQPGSFVALLLAALAASLAGDVFLMFPGYFIPGLVAFLVAHLCYIALFKQGLPWFPSRTALAATLGVGGAMYAFLWLGGLPAALRLPVACYVIAIALMAAQAIGRALVPRDPHATSVAVGACAFMLSDALLATNRFVMPLPLAPFWVLSTYYLAQVLIVVNVRPAGAAAPQPAAGTNRSATPLLQ